MKSISKVEKSRTNYEELEVYKNANRLAAGIQRFCNALPVSCRRDNPKLITLSTDVITNLVKGFTLGEENNLAFKERLVEAILACNEIKSHLDVQFNAGAIKEEYKYRYFKNEYTNLAHDIEKELRR